MYPSWLRIGLYAAHHAAGDAEDQRARGELRREHVSRDGAGRRRVPAEADELPGPYSDLQELAEELSRVACTLCRAGECLSLRAVGHDAWAAARARPYAGRCAHLLHA